MSNCPDPRNTPRAQRRVLVMLDVDVLEALEDEAEGRSTTAGLLASMLLTDHVRLKVPAVPLQRD